MKNAGFHEEKKRKWKKYLCYCHLMSHGLQFCKPIKARVKRKSYFAHTRDLKGSCEYKMQPCYKQFEIALRTG